MDTGVAKQGIQSTMSIEKCESNEIEVLIEEYANMVFQLALAKTKNTQLAEDIFQDVFLKIIGKKRVFKSKEHERAWILRVTLNSCKDLWKSAWMRRTVPLEEYKASKKDTDGNEWVYEIVMELPEKYRLPIHLFYYEEFSVEEIGKILKLNKNTVATRLKRAREILKGKLEKEGVFDGF